MKDTSKAQVLSLVKKMINRREETKVAGRNVWNAVNFNNSIGSSDLYGVLPPLSVGNESYQRDGSKVFPKYLILKGTLAIDKTEAYSDCMEVRLMVLSAKGSKSYYAINSGSTKADFAGKLMNTHQNVSAPGSPPICGPYDGTTAVHLMDINRDLFHVHADKKIKLCSSYGSTANARSSDDQLRYRDFTIKVKCPKVLDFEDNIDPLYPSNFAPFVCMGFTYPDGRAPSDLSVPLLANCQAFLYYKDA